MSRRPSSDLPFFFFALLTLPSPPSSSSRLFIRFVSLPTGFGWAPAVPYVRSLSLQLLACHGPPYTGRNSFLLSFVFRQSPARELFAFLRTSMSSVLA